MGTIQRVVAREILDSRGNPTVEADLWLSDGSFGRASVPSGASTGAHEAVELRDGDTKRYGGLGVRNAIAQINGEIASLITGLEYHQYGLDQALCDLDGTENKARLGANAILAVSLAFCRASAVAAGVPLYQWIRTVSQTNNAPLLPLPFMNIINGGKHAEGAADFQEVMIVPVGASSFTEGLRYGAETFHALKKILRSRGLATTVGDEGGFAPALPSNTAALDLIVEAIEAAGFKPGEDIAIAMDAAASSFYKDGNYHLLRDNRVLRSDELVAWYAELVEKYPIISIEDSHAEEDWDGFVHMHEKLGATTQLVGDDLFVTNRDFLRKGIERLAANAILIKLNQIGTVSEAMETVHMARGAGFKAMVSHRSGETEDTSIADFAVGMAIGQIKTGSLSRGERIGKYNQLLRIEEELNLVSKG